MATVLPNFDNHPLLADAELDCLLDDDWAAAELQSADLQPLAAAPPAPQEAAPEPAPVAKAGSAVLIEPPAEVAGFVRTLFTLLRVCDPVVIGWSRDGKVLLVRDPARFLAKASKADTPATGIILAALVIRRAFVEASVRVSVLQETPEGPFQAMTEAQFAEWSGDDDGTIYVDVREGGWSAHMHDAQLALRMSRTVGSLSFTSAYSVLLFAHAGA